MNKKLLKKIIRKIPGLSGTAKVFYDWRQEKRLMSRVNSFLKKDSLPFKDIAPSKYSVGYEPTIRCNLRCKMCYQGENRNLRQAELGKEETLSVFEKLKDKTEEIKLVGGEPFARQDILELIAFWDRAKKRIILQTNCTLINDANIVNIKDFKYVSDILTSLDGPQEVHDAIRGVPGAFDKLKRALNLIHIYRPDISFTVFATMLIHDNLDKLFELVDTAKKLGLGTINILFEQVYSSANLGQVQDIFKNVFGWAVGQDYRLNTQIRQPIFPPDLNLPAIKKKLAAVRRYGLKRGCFVNFTPFNYYQHLEHYFGQKEGKVFCLKLLEPELRINQQGEVIWCDIIEKSFGSLLNHTPDEIWLSPEYQKFRQYLFKQSFPICSRCCKAVYI